ncbi:LysM peptidoglycan-binding domain-containing protein [Mucilaginibacter sp.]|jgi:hypothetical protein|uniref:LysM peptidoglycan-binding domain-containing protein n=1 Tax=Mucilaginibacter sp. TaxID=1882438 RepID=UPI002B825B5F|nr:LysM peptidoglycan-binding domain-containing protein [Mucilaginibacter sp.]HTI60213.1 LysM peptidoglycan-binding domain-containing protein [Mucilaginibacter sp.]
MNDGIIAGGSFKGNLKLGDLISAFTGGAIKIPDHWNVEFTDINGQVDTGGKTYSVGATANVELQLFGDTSLIIQQAYFEINANYGQEAGGDNVFNATMGGLFGIGDITTQEGVFVMLTAVYNSEGGEWTWDIDAVTEQPIQLSTLVNQLFNSFGLPDFIPGDLVLNRMEFKAMLAKGKENIYAFSIDIGWQYETRYLTIDIPHAGLNLNYDGNAEPGKQYSGDIYGQFLLDIDVGNGISVDVKLKYTFTPDNKELQVEWKGVIGTYDFTNDTITIQFDNLTLGDLIVSFVEMLGIENFKIDSPWDLVNDISLNGFEVIFNLKTKQVTLEYTLPSSIDLVFININGFMLTCNSGGESKIKFGLNATSPLAVPGDESWNNLLDPNKGQDIQNMPSVPGKGSSLFDLKYLGLGQRVSLFDITDINTVEQATSYLETAFQQPADNTSSAPVGPTGPPGTLVFDSSSSWLAGTQLTLIDTVSFSIVFNDPKLYGLLISLSGQKAKSFAGLKFEILYKKVTDTIGMYYLELTLPDVMRHLEFGEVSITLPVVGLTIYTDGKFKIDFGFPASLNDFSRSFTLQAFPFTGSGGFYFAYIDAVASKHVPQTSKGTFHPVIEFGIAMQVGLGKTIDEGILQAGLSLTMTGMVQGSLAWYYANDGSDSDDFFYWLQGTMGIVGKLYGSINFAIITASLTVEISASIAATLESYHAILLTLEVEVDVELTVTIHIIFSINIHLGFHMKLTQDLTIGSDNLSAAPWYDPNSNYELLYKPVPKEHLTRLNGTPGASHLRMIPLRWKAFRLDESQKENLQFYFVPHLTVSTGPTGPQSPQYVAMLYTDISAGPTGPTGPSAPLSSFEKLAKGTLMWVINTMIHEEDEVITNKTSTEGISIGQLQNLLNTLNNSSTTPISNQDIQNFLTSYFNIYIAQPDEVESAELHATVFPMLPGLILNYSGAKHQIDFSNYNLADKDYQKDIQHYFEKLFVNFENSLEKKNNNGADKQSLIKKSLDNISMAEYIFQDFFLMLAKALVQNAINYIKGYQMLLVSPNAESLNSIVAEFNSIYAPGVTGPTGSFVYNDIEIATLAERNKSAKLATNTSLYVGGYPVTVPNTVSLYQIAQLFNVPVATLAQVNQTTPDIIVAGTIIEYLAPNGPTGALPYQYTVRPGDNMLDIIAGLGGGVTAPTGPTGYPITVPAVAEYNKDKNILNESVLTVPARIYGIKSSDTFQDISDKYLAGPTGTGNYFHGALALTGPTANISQVARLMNTNNYIQGLIAPGTSITGPTGSGYFYKASGLTGPTGPTGPTAYIVQPADTILTLTQALKLTTEQLAEYIKDRPVLSTGKSLTIPSVSMNTGPTGGTYTLDSLSNKYGLPVNQLAISNAGITGIFAGGQQLPVPNLVCLELNTIIDGLKDNGSYSNQAGLGARVFLSGLNLPVTSHIHINPGDPGYGQATEGLYNLTGQQLAINDVSTNYWLAVGKSEPGSLTGVYFGVAPTGPTGSGVYRKGLGITGPTGPTGSGLYFSPDQKEVDWINAVANEQLTLDVPYGPLPLYQEIPKQYTLRNQVLWQYPGQLVLPYNNNSGQVDAQPGIWMFPQSLLNDLQDPGRPQGIVLDLKMVTRSRPGFPVVRTNIDFYGWSTSINVKIKKLNGGTAITKQTYEVIGAQESDVTLLERLVTYMNTQPGGDNIIYQLQVLYATSSATNTQNGLQSESIGGASFILTQANLSTVTNPDSGSLFSGLSQTQNVINTFGNFVTLLWEASIVRSGGYYLYYNDNDSNTGLPQSLFNQDQIGEITLVITYTAQAFTSGVQDFVNSVTIGNNIDNTNSVVYAEALDIMTRVAHVPPGNVGIKLTRPTPDQLGINPSSPQYYLQENYNLLGYRLAATGGFTGSNDGMPISFVQATNPTGPPGPTGPWEYSRVIPVFKYYNGGQDHEHLFGLTGPTGPANSENPYLGVGMTATIQLDWIDLFGNKTKSNPAFNDVPVPVGFIDPVIAIAQCPSLSSDYLYTKGVTMPNLGIELTFSNAKYKPVTGPSGISGSAFVPGITGPTGATAAMNHAAIDIETYKKLFYQVTSLGNSNGAGIYVNTSIDPGKAIPVSNALVLNYIAEIYDYLLDIENGNFNAPLPGDDGKLSLNLPITDTNPDTIFELEVSVTIVRDRALINNDFLGQSNVQSSTTNVKPKLVGPTGATGPTGPTGPPARTMLDFASKFEDAFSDIANKKLVKVATGDDRFNIAASGDDKTVWVVRMGQQRVNFAIQLEQGPYYFAPKPLSNTLLSLNNIPTYDYISGQGLTMGHQKSYSSVDLDKWGQQFLAAMDDFLAPEFAVPANIISSAAGPTGPSGFFGAMPYTNHRLYTAGVTGPTGVYQRILDAKQQIAGAIANQIATIVGPTGPTGASVSVAQETLKQELLSQLSNAYTINTIIQHPVSVDGGNGSTLAPRLFGRPVTTHSQGNLRRELMAVNKMYGLGADGPTGADYTLSTAKIPLEQTGQSWLTYTFSTKDAAKYQSIDLRMNYEVSNIEHQIGNVPGITGYQASSWLSFVIPLSTSGLESVGMQPQIGPTGPIEIPVPLRAYPAPPSLNSQGFVAGPTGGNNCISSLDQFLKWDYNYNYTEVTARQDSIQTVVQYNVEGVTGSRAFFDEPITLDVALAQFIDVYAAIRNDFVNSLVKINSTVKNTGSDFITAASALEAFAFLSGNIADAWPRWAEVVNERKIPLGVTNAYSIKESDDNGFLKLSVQSLAKPANPVFPTVYISDYNTTMTGPAGPTGAPVPVGPTSQVNYWYEKDGAYLGYQQGMNYPSRKVQFGGLDILQTQNAWGGVSIIRNLNLFKNQPDIVTNDYFVYQTPLIRQSTPLIPLIGIEQAINIACLGGTSPAVKYLAQHLSELFSNLLSTASGQQLLKVQCEYVYTIREDYLIDSVVLPVMVTVPLLFNIGADWNIGQMPYCSAGDNSFVCQLTQTITQWVNSNGLSTNTGPSQNNGPFHYNGKLIFKIEIYSKTDNRLPLLQLNNLYLEITNIIW